MGFVSESFADLNSKYMRRMGLKNVDVIRLLGLTAPTWYRYKRRPWTIPQGVLREYVKIMRLSKDDVVKIMEAYR